MHTMLPTSETLEFPARRTHRTYDAQFKAEMVAASARPGASISALALAQGMNPNVLHRWLREHERSGLHQLIAVAALQPANTPAIKEFVPLRLPSPAAAPTSAVAGKPLAVEVELRKGDLQMNVRWPVSLTAEFANWTATLLR